MKIPPDQNTRAEAMWRIISPRVDFRGKRVGDLGCGTGDFLWRVCKAGAIDAFGVDIDISKTEKAYGVEIASWGAGLSFSQGDIKIHIGQQDINEIVASGRGNKPNIDIALCFSVLPYLDNVPATLKWMSTNFPLCLIECQYAGDGPGLPNIGADKGMMQLLFSNGFDSAEPIGRTYPEDRTFPNGEPVYRTIWLCETKES